MVREDLNYCDNCHVYVDAAMDRCPLCRKILTDQPAENGLYADIFPTKHVDQRTFYQDLLIFLTFAFVLGAITINMLTWNGVPWFLAVAAPIVYTWIVLKSFVYSQYLFGTKVFLQFVGIMAMMLAFDYVAGWSGWSINWVMPFLLIGANVLIDVYAYSYKSRWKASLLYALLFAALGCLPLIFFAVHITSAMVPMILSTAASGLSLLGILRFAVRTFVLEMKKRFHM